MKKISKALTLSLCAVLLVATSVLGTMAYLTSQDQVVNTFTVGNVKITLDEAKTDENGLAVSGGGRVQENEYKLMPGHTYTKDPTVHIDKNSEDCYIRMLVKIENWNTLAGKVTGGIKPEDICEWNTEFWPCYRFIVVGDNAVLEFRHSGVLTTASEIPALFETITLPEEVEDMTGLENVKVIVAAEAIQADGFDDATEAFTALADASKLN